MQPGVHPASAASQPQLLTGPGSTQQTWVASQQDCPQQALPAAQVGPPPKQGEAWQVEDWQIWPTPQWAPQTPQFDESLVRSEHLVPQQASVGRQVALPQSPPLEEAPEPEVEPVPLELPAVLPPEVELAEELPSGVD